MVSAVLTAMVALLVSARGGSAQEPTRLAPVVVTATKLEASQERLGASVTVIPGEELRARHVQTLGDALRQAPGVEVQQQGSLGKRTTVRIRGAAPEQVQVLVDGVRVKSPTTGEFNLSTLDLESIERIEVVRGPQSTLHGADAIGGVVNIITKRGRGAPTASARVEGGNYGTHRERVALSGSWKIFDYALGGSAAASSGQFDNDDSDQQALSGRFGLRLPLGGHVGLTTRYAKTSTDLPVDRTIRTPPFFVLDPDAQQQNELTVLSLAWEQRPVRWYELRARLGQVWNQLDSTDPRTPGVDTRTTITEVDTARREAEVLQAVHLGAWDTLTLGFEHRIEDGRSRGNFDESVDVVSGFVQNELRPTGWLVLSGGTRLEDNDTFGTAVTSRAGALLDVEASGTRLRASWGEGFRAPTLNDLFFPGFGNPGLEPERSESWDAGLEQRLWGNRARVGVTYFRNSFDDLIQNVRVGSTVRPENVGRARTQGIEAEAAVDLLDTLTASVNYTFTDTEDLDTGGPLRRFARHRWHAGLDWEPVRALSLFARAFVVSSQFEGEGFPRNPGYHRIDAGATWRLAEPRGPFPGLDAVVRIQNLTNQQYSETLGFEALGINALVGLQARY